MQRRMILVGLISSLLGFLAPALAADSPSPSAGPCPLPVELFEGPQRLTQQGCCSWHGGVCGCYGTRVVCCDGRFSPSCTCNDSGPQPSPTTSLAVAEGKR
jgi:hypothetical protein